MNITLEVDQARHEIIAESLACFAIKERRQADEEATSRQAEEHRARAAEADCIRQLIEPQLRHRSTDDQGSRVQLEPHRWFVLTESLEVWADLRERGTGVDHDVETARELVDELDRQLDGRDRRLMQREASRRLNAR